jgi:pimeloyl-ACP methyl ester carboxylesterase
MASAHHGDVELYYETFGSVADGDPLLLVNGLGSQCINYRAEWCELFVAAGFFVIRFDNRDVGLSTKFTGADLPAYRLTDMAGDAIAVLDAVGVERAHVLGLSMGGMIVQTLAIEHPERLRSLTSMMSTTGDPDVGQPSPEAWALLRSPAPSGRDGYIARQLDGSRTWGTPACFDADRIARNAGEAYDRCFCPDGQLRQMAAIGASGSRTDALRSVRVPTLVLHGDADRLVDISGGRRTAEVIPGARFVVIEGLGHDYPPAYWDRIVSLVAEHALGASALSRPSGSPPAATTRR